MVAGGLRRPGCYRERRRFQDIQDVGDGMPVDPAMTENSFYSLLSETSALLGERHSLDQIPKPRLVRSRAKRHHLRVVTMQLRT